MQLRNLIAFLRARLSPEGFLGLHLTLSIIVLVAATWIFAAIAEDVVTGDSITTVDARFSGWLHANGSPGLTKFMLLVSALHGTWVIIFVTLALCLYLWIRRLRLWVITFASTVFGGILLNVLLKNIFHRSRPSFVNPIVRLTTYSFPSGHTLMATVFYGTLCILFISRTHISECRLLAITAVVLAIALVGFSRVYLGAHYLSDVLAAMMEGVAWLTLCMVAVRLSHLKVMVS
ncbi:MAG: phosphatase PAP2 family protein [Pyrinomonadaceae bacterium]